MFWMITWKPIKTIWGTVSDCWIIGHVNDVPRYGIMLDRSINKYFAYDNFMRDEFGRYDTPKEAKDACEQNHYDKLTKSQKECLEG